MRKDEARNPFIIEERLYVMTSFVAPRVRTGVAFSAAAAGLALGVATTFILAGLIPAGVGGEFALATKIIDAIIAGSTVAAIVGLLLGGGLGVGVIATCRWAISFFGRRKAIA